MARVRNAVSTILFLGLLLVAGCRKTDAPSDWVPHATPSGLHFSLPPGWNAAGDSDGRVNITGSSSEQGVIWPVFMRAQLDGNGAQAVARTLGKRIWPGASWSALPATGNIVRLQGHDAQRNGMMVFSWVPTPKGTAAMLHMGNSPSTQYGKDAPVFAEIFSSARVQGAESSGDDAAAAPKTTQYTRWRDPKEGSFTLEVPSGWKTEGGLFRYAAIDVRPMVRTTSPDGEIMAQLGDANIPAFAEPNSMMAMAGLNEGSWYNPGSVKLMVERYQTGSQFAYSYAQKASQLCSGVRIGSPRSRNDAVAALNQQNSQYQAQGVMVQSTAGEVTISCSKNGAPYSGYIFAATQVTRTQGIGQWYVQYLFVYLAPSSRDAEAHDVLKHMVATYQTDPQWMASQSQTTMNVSKITAQTSQQISDTIMSGYEERQKTMDEISRRRENAILGEVDVVSNGQRYKVENSSNYYWADGQGNIVGTQSHTRPDINFQEMMQMP